MADQDNTGQLANLLIDEVTGEKVRFVYAEFIQWCSISKVHT